MGRQTSLGDSAAVGSNPAPETKEDIRIGGRIGNLPYFKVSSVLVLLNQASSQTFERNRGNVLGQNVKERHPRSRERHVLRVRRIFLPFSFRFFHLLQPSLRGFGSRRRTVSVPTREARSNAIGRGGFIDKNWAPLQCTIVYYCCGARPKRGADCLLRQR